MLKGRYDFRSDTVTEPTPEMRRAMFEAEVGDSARGDDPTVQALEELAAERMGKEAAVYLPSGIMANLTAALTWTQRGDELVAEARAHMVISEVGNLGAVAGVLLRTIEGRDGIVTPEQVAAAIRPDSTYHPRTGLICVENTHNFAGGSVYTPDQIEAIAAVARARRIPVHLDGARIFNAAVALGVPANRLAAPVDSVMFCVSKGLSAPIGSLLCGSRDFVELARKRRTMIGGGMRQAGIVAAAGIVAIRTMVERLAEDHARARRLGELLQGIRGVRVAPPPQTNMVMLHVDDTGIPAARWAERLAGEHNVWVLAVGPHTLRFVTHRHIDDADVEAAARAVEQIARSAPGHAA